MEFSFTDELNRDTDQAEAADIVESGKVFSRVLWEVSHPVAGFDHPSEVVLQRTDISEEMGLGSREDNAVHPSLIIWIAYRD